MAMHADIWWAALVGGVATVLIRLLPSLASDRLAPDRLGPRTRAMAQSLGPAAIAALLALALADLLPVARLDAALPPVLAGAAAVALVHRLTANPAWATLAGALAYGLAGAFSSL